MPVVEAHSAKALTRAAAVRALTARLTAADVPTPGLDARLLVAAAAGVSGIALLAEPDVPLDEAACRRLEAWAERRAAREPVSRILGRRGFYGRDFTITPAVLDPRPESETVVEVALAHVKREGLGDRKIRMLDVGTGSGALLLTLLAELPRARGLGTDLSDAALDVARGNAQRLGLGSQATWQCADLLDGVEGPFDLVVANLPYIARGDLEGLLPDVRDYDPRRALDGGPDGLALYRRFVPSLGGMGAGFVAVEVGRGQAAAVTDLAEAAGCRDILTADDLAGVTRVVAWKPQRVAG